MTTSACAPYTGYRFPAEIIGHAATAIETEALEQDTVGRTGEIHTLVRGEQSVILNLQFTISPVQVELAEGPVVS